MGSGGTGSGTFEHWLRARLHRTEVWRPALRCDYYVRRPHATGVLLHTGNCAFLISPGCRASEKRERVVFWWKVKNDHSRKGVDARCAISCCGRTCAQNSEHSEMYQTLTNQQSLCCWLSGRDFAWSMVATQTLDATTVFNRRTTYKRLHRPKTRPFFC